MTKYPAASIPTSLLIRTIANYIVASGGKRLRPAAVAACADAFGAEGTAKHELAAVIAFIRPRPCCTRRGQTSEPAPRAQDRERGGRPCSRCWWAIFLFRGRSR